MASDTAASFSDVNFARSLKVTQPPTAVSGATYLLIKSPSGEAVSVMTDEQMEREFSPQQWNALRAGTPVRREQWYIVDMVAAARRATS